MSPRQSAPLSIEHALLGLLSEQPMHGYELYQRLLAPDALGAIWPLKRAQFYNLLAKLEQAGYVHRECEPSDQYPPRQVLHLTPAGRAAFTSWLQQPLAPDSDMQRDVLARFFFARRAGTEALQAMLARQRSASQRERAELQRQLAARPDPSDFVALALRWRLHQLEATLHWLETQRVLPGANAPISYAIAALRDSPQLPLARRFVAAVCAPPGQDILRRHGFLVAEPAATAEHGERLPLAQGSLTVYAAASLTRAFREIGRQFEAAYPGTRIAFQFAGSHQLAHQLVHGAAADVFASAHPRAMEQLVAAGRVAAADPQTCAANRLALATSRARPAQLLSLADLARPGRRLVFGSAATAIGHYALALLDQGEQCGDLDAHERLAVLQNVVGYAETPHAVLEQVLAGEADVGIVFASDCSSMAEHIVSPLLYPATLPWSSS